MKLTGIKGIVTDIEGTTTSVSFVYETLFPYFGERFEEVKELLTHPEHQPLLKSINEFAEQEQLSPVSSVNDAVKTLRYWFENDKKITPLKQLQGIVWKAGYEKGLLKGHIYDDVPQLLDTWQKQGKCLAVFSSGSVSAQRLLFGYSTHGDLCPYFSAYFDTTTGMKRDSETYMQIANTLNLAPNELLFLSDICEELEAAEKAGYRTIQLTRPGTKACWHTCVNDFTAIELD